MVVRDAQGSSARDVGRGRGYGRDSRPRRRQHRPSRLNVGASHGQGPLRSAHDGEGWPLWVRHPFRYEDYFEAVVWAMVLSERVTGATEIKVFPLSQLEAEVAGVAPNE